MYVFMITYKNDFIHCQAAAEVRVETPKDQNENWFSGAVEGGGQIKIFPFDSYKTLSINLSCLFFPLPLFSF